MGDNDPSPEAAQEEAHRQLTNPQATLPKGMRPEEVARLLAYTAAKNARMLSQVLNRLKRTKLFGPDREMSAEWRDPIGVQALFEMRDRYYALLEAPMHMDETATDRQVKLAAILDMICKAQDRMHDHVHRITEHQMKCAVEARKLEQAQAHHQDKIDLEREKMAKLVKAATDGMTDAELERIAKGNGTP
jgi:hypothetical protein